MSHSESYEDDNKQANNSSSNDEENIDNHTSNDKVDNDITDNINQQDNTQKDESKQSDKFMPREAMLELIESDDGCLLLRDMAQKEEPLVSIKFSEKVKDMLGDDVQHVGQQMIHAAIQTVMHKQMKSWHAHVHDEEPKNYS